MPSTLVIIPAHNEAENLLHVLPLIREVVPEADILVVDDYSTDATSEIASQLGAIVVRLPNNLGYGGAVQTGFRFGARCGYDYGITMDADGQHDPSNVPDLLAHVQSDSCDLVVGSRFTGTMTYRASWVRRLGMRVFAGIASYLTKSQVTDATSGFQAMTGEVMEFLAVEDYPSDYPDADTLIMLHYAGFQVEEIPVTMHDRLSGEAMHGNILKNFYYIFKMLLSMTIVYFRHRTYTGSQRNSTAANAT